VTLTCAYASHCWLDGSGTVGVFGYTLIQWLRTFGLTCLPSNPETIRFDSCFGMWQSMQFAARLGPVFLTSSQLSALWTVA
jgi:hypothetical protein